MLVISRAMGDAIVVDNDTVIKVLEIRSERVRLEIANPRGPIHRDRDAFEVCSATTSRVVLSCEKHDRFTMRAGVIVSVFDIRADKVRLAISCPKHVSVHRNEVYEALWPHGKAT